MNYKMSNKINGKWRNFGSVRTNKYGNLQASFKVTPELLELFHGNEGNWVNFAMFEDKPKDESSAPKGGEEEIPW